MSSAKQWTAILAGALLLSAGPLVRELSRVGAWADAVLRGSETPSPNAALRQRIVDKLASTNPKLGDEMTSRIVDAVFRCSHDQQLRPDLVAAVIIVESGARPEVRSSKGAVGLMQVMPYIFERLEMPGNVAHIESNIEAGCLVLGDNIRRLGEDDGISSYFWGRRIRGEGYLRRVRTTLRELALRQAGVSARGRG